MTSSVQPERSALRDLVEELPRSGSWRIGKDLRVRGTPGAERLLGIAPGGSLSLPELADRVDAADRPKAVAAAKRAFDARAQFDLQISLTGADGDAVRLRVVGEPQFEDQTLIGMAGLVAPAPQSAAAPTSSDPHSDAPSNAAWIIRQSPSPVGLIDRTRRLVCASPALEALLGQTGFDATRFDPALPWAPERWLRAIDRALLGESAHSDADPVTLPDGALRWLRWSISPVRDAIGDVFGAMLTLFDVTEITESRRSIEASRERMADGLDMAEVLICSFDLERRTSAIEGDWKQFFPQPPSLHTLMGEDAAIHPSDRAGMAELWIAHLGGAPAYAVNYRVQQGDGRETWHAASIRIQRAPGGAAARVIAVVQDITERKLSEVRLRDAEQRARVAAAAKSDFLANISHEIRTPLNGVLAVSELLQRTSLDERQTEMVQLVCASGAMLLRVMDDIVEYTRIEADAVEIEVRPFDLETVLRSACEAGGHRAEAKGLFFECYVSASLDGVFRGDPVRIGQIVGHLLSNAVKFTDQGKVSFTAAGVEMEGRTEVTLTVADTGSGFPPEIAARIFEQFEQGDGSTSRRHGGLGLGLSIVKRLVDLMGGRIHVTSIPGSGTIFEVVLPLQRDRIAALASLNTVPVEGLDAETRLDDLRLLVAEDNPMNRRVVELLLAPAGIRLQFAENGQEACDQFMAGKFNLVLMDLQMPVMDGLAAMRTIRRFERDTGRVSTPILALSANASETHVREAKDAGADDHVAKPIVRDVLFDAIARYTQRPSNSDGDIDLDELDLAI